MKKILLIAGFAVAMSGTAAYAQHGCDDCGDESTTTGNVYIKASVRVPLQSYVADNNIEFPCINRSTSYTIDPDHNISHPAVSGTPMNTGRTALVEVFGDENDEIKAELVGGGNTVVVRHTNTSAQYSDGPTNDDTMNVVLQFHYETGINTTNPSNADVVSNGTFPAALLTLGNGPEIGPYGGPGIGEGDMWIGGTITSSDDQQRGNYYGSFRIKFDYVQ